ncbi:MAG: DUF1730 domain-containing protein, partial [Chloroflexi bacterium]|nr:DUF1730 domain-containing protein [Chloroflexota bacterium]
MSQGAQGSLEARLKAQAEALGFDLVGIAAAGPTLHSGAYLRWLEAGRHAGMAYLARPDAVAKRLEIERVLPGVQSVVMAAKNYYSGDFDAAQRTDPRRGLISRYAWGQDYHHVLLPRLKALGRWLDGAAGPGLAWRAYVDTGPILEREWAVRAGMGFVGRNATLIHPRWGSYLFLGVLLVTI